MAFRRKPDNQDEYHRKFADAVIEQIRKGTAPWQKPWGPGESYRPANAVTGRPYTGGNSLYLNMRGEQRGFGDNRWATYKQIRAEGGQVRKGERGEQVLFFDNMRRIAVKDAKGKPKKVEGKQVYQTVKRDVPFIKTFTVFNAEQADGLKLERQGGREVPLWQTHQAAEVVIEESKVSVRHVEGDRAFYSIKSDSITLPDRAQFPRPTTTTRRRSTSWGTAPAIKIGWTASPCSRAWMTGSAVRPMRAKSSGPRSAP